MRAAVTSLVLASLCLTASAACKRSAPAPAGGTGTATATGTAAADPWGSTQEAGAPATRIQKPFLYAVTRAETPAVTTYLFGTMHIGINGETQLPPWVWTKLDGARAFAMEADVSEPEVMKALARTDGGSLQAELGAEHWKKLKEVIGDPLAEGMNHFKPFAVMTVLATKDLPMTPPMDQVMHKRAKDAGKPIVFLESAMRQLEIIDPFMTAADIKAYLDNLAYAKTQTLGMIEMYADGDEVALGKLFEDQTLWVAAGRDPKTFAGYVDAILGNRNASWIPAIEQIHAEGGGFVAVGAGHLVGPRSVVQLMADKGYTVSRVTGP